MAEGLVCGNRLAGASYFNLAMASLIIVIIGICQDKAAEALFIQHNHVVEQPLSACSAHLSATPFCQGARYEVRHDFMPGDRMTFFTSELKI